MEAALRWVLLAAGLALVAGIWAWGLWRERRAARERVAAARAARARLDPAEAEAALAALEAEARRGVGARAPAAADGGPELVVAVHVAVRGFAAGRARERERWFRGPALARALEQCGLEPGPRRIYHRMAHGRPVFSVASMIEPGHLEPEALADESFATPGLAVFMTLPGPLEAREAFDRMLETARRLAAHLDGELLDERRSALTPQTVAWLRERVAQWALRHGLRPVAP